MTRTSLRIGDDIHMAQITGPADKYLRKIEDAFDVAILVSGNQIDVDGDERSAGAATMVLEEIMRSAVTGHDIGDEALDRAIDLSKRPEFSLKELSDDVILTHRGHAVRPKTPGQKRYIDAIRRSAITFGVGPAGTGKTYLAMAMAISALERGEVARIVLSRPIIEAGESLGFLPGTLNEKVDPYIRPLYDALFDMMDAEAANRLLENGTLEIAPLAFMRGRTLNGSFVILDEAQNATNEQMKMFLTRLGYGSKMVVTGDLTQSDLPCKASGLKEALSILDGIEGISIENMGGADVVRNSLVLSIIKAYDKASR